MHQVQEALKNIGIPVIAGIWRDLGDKAEVFTDEDIKLFLNHVFSFSGIQKLLTQMREIRSGESRFTMEQLFENARTTPQTAPQATRTEERFSATS